MAKKYKTHFEINRNELELIEKALREQAQQLGQKIIDDRLASRPSEASDADRTSSRMKEIQSILGSLHNQKIWYRTQDLVPYG